MEVELDSDRPPSTCRSLRITPAFSAGHGNEQGVTASLIRELPVGSLIEEAQARAALDDSQFHRNVLGAGILSMLVRANVIKVTERDNDGVVTAAQLADGPVNPYILGERLARIPREPPHGRRGAPPVAQDFLAEVAAVHRLARLYRIPSTKLILRYLDARLDETTTTIDRYREKRISRWLSQCRDKGLL